MTENRKPQTRNRQNCLKSRSLVGVSRHFVFLRSRSTGPRFRTELVNDQHTETRPIKRRHLSNESCHFPLLVSSIQCLEKTPNLLRYIHFRILPRTVVVTRQIRRQTLHPKQPFTIDNDFHPTTPSYPNHCHYHQPPLIKLYNDKDIMKTRKDYISFFLVT